MDIGIEREAREVIEGERKREYGSIDTSFERIARMWSSVLNHPVSAREVALCMICLKVIRESHAHKHDNLVDIFGYKICLEYLDGEGK